MSLFNREANTFPLSCRQMQPLWLIFSLPFHWRQHFPQHSVFTFAHNSCLLVAVAVAVAAAVAVVVAVAVAVVVVVAVAVAV